MAGHRAFGKGNKEGQNSEPYYTRTSGGVLTGPAIYANGIPGDPRKPGVRGDAKELGTGGFPCGSGKPPGNKGPYGAFGIKGESQNGSGGKKGSAT